MSREALDQVPPRRDARGLPIIRVPAPSRAVPEDYTARLDRFLRRQLDALALQARRPEAALDRFGPWWHAA